MCDANTLGNFLGLTAEDVQNRVTVNQRLTDFIVGVEELYGVLCGARPDPVLRLADPALRQQAIERMRGIVEDDTDIDLDEDEQDREQAERDQRDGNPTWPFCSGEALGV